MAASSLTRTEGLEEGGRLVDPVHVATPPSSVDSPARSLASAELDDKKMAASSLNRTEGLEEGGRLVDPVHVATPPSSVELPASLASSELDDTKMAACSSTHSERLEGGHPDPVHLATPPASVDSPWPSFGSSELEDDVFEDANAEENAYAATMDLQRSFQDCEVAIHKFFNNDIPGAINIMKPWAAASLYHSLGLSIFEFIPAVLTCEKNQIRAAIEAIKTCIDICNVHRRRYTFAQNLSSIIKKPNYADYTDLQAHAELCYAEALLLQAALTVLEGEDYSSYLSSTLKVKSCYNIYQACWTMKERKRWDTRAAQVHFNSGVRLGTATFNLLISLLPPSAVTFLEFVGFSGSKSYALQELAKGAKLPGMRSVLCNLTLLVHHLIICPFIGGQGDMKLCDEILQKELLTYPNSAWFLALRGRSEFLKARLRAASRVYSRACVAQNHFRQFRLICYWDLMWVHGLNLDFEEAAVYAEKLVEESAWSMTTHTYIIAAMLLQNEASYVTDNQRNLIEESIRTAPQYKVRIAGKSLPMEKFVIRRCQRYVQQNRRLIMPAFELMCLWNMFHILTNDKEHLYIILRMIEKTRDAIEDSPRDWMGDYEADNMALLHFIHGSALSAMQLPRQALIELTKVLMLKKRIKEDTFLVPYAVCEMAMCYFQMGDMKLSLQCLSDAKKKYSGYYLQTRLHFRVQARIEIVRSEIGAIKFKPAKPLLKIPKDFDEVYVP